MEDIALNPTRLTEHIATRNREALDSIIISFTMTRDLEKLVSELLQKVLRKEKLEQMKVQLRRSALKQKSLVKIIFEIYEMRTAEICLEKLDQRYFGFFKLKKTTTNDQKHTNQ